MAVLKTPLLSFGARGKIGDSLVFAAWRGVAYVRRHVIPANPQSTAQTLTRDIFATLEEMWKTGGPLMRAAFNLYATGQKFVGRNAYLGKNIEAMRGDANMDAYIGSPGAKGGLAPNSVSTVAGVGTITVTFVNPTPPTGWALVSAIATAHVDQAPETDPVIAVVEAEDAAAPMDTVVLSGLTTVLHQVSCWLEWTKVDGTTCYGPSINDQETPT